MLRVVGVSFLWGFLFIVGCSRPPEVPVIENSNNESFPEIGLRDSLSPKDFRNIFEALNQKGKLNGLKPWFQSTSDADLDILGSAVNKYFYQDAFNPYGLPALVEHRVQQKGFSNLNKNLALATKNFPDFSFGKLLKSALNHPATPKLLQRGSFFIDPKWDENFEPFKNSDFFFSTSTSDLTLILNDLKRLIESPAFEKEFISACDTLRNSELGKTFFISLQQLEETHDESVYLSLSEKLKESLQSSNELSSLVARLLKLTQILNRPSAGIFSEAQKTLKTEEGEALVRLLSERFEPVILKGAAGFIRETLKEPFDNIELTPKFWMELPRKNPGDLPTENFIQLIRRIQFSLDKMAHSSRTIKDPAVVLNTLLLAKWFEEMAKNNAELIGTLEKNNFQESFWQAPIQPFPFSTNLLELDEKGKPIKDSNGKYNLANQIEKELKAIGLEEFANDLKWSIKQDSFGPTSIKINLGSQKTTLTNSLKTVVESLHRAHPFADPVPLLSSLAYLFSRPEEGSPLTLGDLESPNMLNSLQSFLRGLSFFQLRKLVNFLFEDLGIGNISAEDRERLKSLYPNNPETAELLDNILQNLQSFYELDKHSSQEISLLEFYHSVLANSRIKDIVALSKLLSFFETTGLFKNSNAKDNYPGLIKALSNHENLSLVLKTMGKISVPQQVSFMAVVNFIAGNQERDIKELFMFLRDVLFNNPKTIPSLLKLLTSGDLTFGVSNSERAWFFQFVNSDSFLNLYRVLITTGDSENLYQLISELEALEKTGDLESLIRILGNMKSDRMQRLALLTWQWEKSRELEALFTFLKTLTKS